MGRGKLKLELIANEKARKTTFQKRKNGIMKKAYEFSVLCGIDVCLFVSGPKLDSAENRANPNPIPNPNPNCSEIETWPPERDAVMRIVRKYHDAAARKLPRKAIGVAEVVAERKRKLDGEIERCRKMISAAKFPDSGELLGRFSAEELVSVAARLDRKIEEVERAIGETRRRKECEEGAKNDVSDKFKTVTEEFFFDEAMGSGGTGGVGLWGPPVDKDQAVPAIGEKRRRKECESETDHEGARNIISDKTDVAEEFFCGEAMVSGGTGTLGLWGLPVYKNEAVPAIGEKTRGMECEEGATAAGEFFCGEAMVSGGVGTLGLWGPPVYNDQAVLPGMLNPGQYYDHYHHHPMMMLGGTSAGGTRSYVPIPLQYVQPVVPYVPYQYTMGVVNVGPRVGANSQVIRATGWEGNSELTSSLVNGFMHGLT